MESGDACLSSLNKLLSRQHPPDTLYWDATGKLGAGAHHGNHIWLGDYDECQSQNDSLYCLADLRLEPNTFSDLTAKNKSIFVRWALCAVQMCNESTIAENIHEIINATLGLDTLRITSASVSCVKDADASFGFHIAVAILSILLSLCFVGTLVDLYHQYRVSCIPKLVHRIDSTGSFLVNPDGSPDEDNPAGRDGDDPAEEWDKPPDQQRLVNAYKQEPGSFVKFWRCFALSWNLARLWSTSTTTAPTVSDSTIRCLHGLRVISMAWVILGHTFAGVLDSKAIANPSVISTFVRRLDGQLVTNAFLAADTFFFLSGLLVCYVALCKIHASEGRFCILRFWLHRYLRLTPCVAFTMVLWMFVLPRFAHGPLTHQLSDPNSTCRAHWWTNLLYVQNFYPTHLDDVCMEWLWYLAVDMQLFLLSPLVIVILHRSKTKGRLTIAGAVLASVATTAALCAHFNINVNLAASLLSVNGSHAAATYENVVYTKPYCRAAPYLVGMLLGYQLHADGTAKKRFPKVWVCAGWVLCAGTMVGLLLGFYRAFHGHEMLSPGNVLYGSLSHVIWAAALGWIVYSCRHGYGGLVDTLLSWRGWEPLSRLTFGAYLLHPLLINSYWGSVRSSIHVSGYALCLWFSGFLTLSLAAAVLLHVLVERPVLNMEAFILTRKTQA